MARPNTRLATAAGDSQRERPAMKLGGNALHPCEEPEGVDEGLWGTARAGGRGCRRQRNAPCTSARTWHAEGPMGLAKDDAVDRTEELGRVSSALRPLQLRNARHLVRARSVCKRFPAVQPYTVGPANCRIARARAV